MRKELHAGERPAIELLYTRYSSMLFSYILQFTPDRKEAENLLVTVFSRLAARLSEACSSTLSIYCWLQVETRKIILESGKTGEGALTYYAGLLQDAPEEQQYVFRELFVRGRQKEELASQLGMEVAYVEGLLRQSLCRIRKKVR